MLLTLVCMSILWRKITRLYKTLWCQSSELTCQSGGPVFKTQPQQKLICCFCLCSHTVNSAANQALNYVEREMRRKSWHFPSFNWCNKTIEGASPSVFPVAWSNLYLIIDTWCNNWHEWIISLHIYII